MLLRRWKEYDVYDVGEDGYEEDACVEVTAQAGRGDAYENSYESTQQYPEAVGEEGEHVACVESVRPMLLHIYHMLGTARSYIQRQCARMWLCGLLWGFQTL